MDRSSYEARERVRGEELARPVHRLALAAGRSIYMQIAFDAELDAIPDDYLALHASAYLGAAGANYWSDEHGIGTIRAIDWTLAREVQIGRASCRKECVSTCRYRWSPYHSNNKINRHIVNR